MTTSERLAAVAAFRMRPGIATGLLALAAILVAADAQGGPVRTVENSGTVCFERGERPGGPAFEGTYVTFRPHLGCVSSSCTEVLRSDFEIEADDGRVDMSSLFSIRQRDGRRFCSADCMGGGRAFRDMKDLTEGVHTVMLGGVELGTLDVAALDAEKHGRVCFSSRKPQDLRVRPRLPKTLKDGVTKE